MVGSLVRQPEDRVFLSTAPPCMSSGVTRRSFAKGAFVPFHIVTLAPDTVRFICSGASSPTFAPGSCALHFNHPRLPLARPGISTRSRSKGCPLEGGEHIEGAYVRIFAVVTTSGVFLESF